MFIYNDLTSLIGSRCGSKKRFFGGGGWVVCFLGLVGRVWVEGFTEMIVRQSGLILRKRAKNSFECAGFWGRTLRGRGLWQAAFGEYKTNVRFYGRIEFTFGFRVAALMSTGIRRRADCGGWAPRSQKRDLGHPDFAGISQAGSGHPPPSPRSCAVLDQGRPPGAY